MGQYEAVAFAMGSCDRASLSKNRPLWGKSVEAAGLLRLAAVAGMFSSQLVPDFSSRVLLPDIVQSRAASSSGRAGDF